MIFNSKIFWEWYAFRISKANYENYAEEGLFTFSIYFLNYKFHQSLKSFMAQYCEEILSQFKANKSNI